jgi:hypothetical protein
MKHLGSVRAGEKRKSSNEEDGEGEREASAIKKRRQDAGLEARDNVVFVPFEERLAPLPPEVDEEREGRFALLPDWKERFAEGEVMVGERREMPADMRRAAEAEGEDEEDEEEEGEDEMPDDGDQMEVDSDEDEEDEEDDDTAAGVDQDVIMQVLRQRLADSGLGDVDESVFKDAIAKMLSGEGDGEDALGGLTSLLLGQKDGGGKAFEGFLAGQGVDLNRTEEEEEGQNNDENDEDESHKSTSTPKAESSKTPKKTNPSSKPTSTQTSAPKNLTPTTRGKSKSKSQSTRSTTSTTTGTTIATPNPKPVSPIVVPSPPPTSFKTSRKRRAPSLDEPALPLPEAPQATSSSSVRPAAKRRRTPRAEPPPPSEPEPATAAGRRTTRSAAAAGKGGR